MDSKIINADVMDGLYTIPDKYVDMCVTSLCEDSHNDVYGKKNIMKSNFLKNSKKLE